MTETAAQRRRRELAELDRVRRRVAAIGFFVIALHGILALPVAARFMVEGGKDDSAVILLVMTGVISVLTVVVMRLILGHRPASVLWLCLGLLPVAAGIWLAWYAPFTVH